VNDGVSLSADGADDADWEEGEGAWNDGLDAAPRMEASEPPPTGAEGEEEDDGGDHPKGAPVHADLGWPKLPFEVRVVVEGFVRQIDAVIGGILVPPCLGRGTAIGAGLATGGDMGSADGAIAGWTETGHDPQEVAVSAARAVLARSMAMVMGPTPPGFGVIQPAMGWTSSKATSPTRRLPPG